MNKNRATAGPAPGALIAVAGLAAMIGAAAAFSAVQFLEPGVASQETVPPPEVSVPIVLAPDRPMPAGPVREMAAAPSPIAAPLSDNDPRWVTAPMPDMLKPAPSPRETSIETAYAEPEASPAKPGPIRSGARAPSANGTPARVNDDVRLRAGPDNHAAVLGVVTRSSPIVVHSCRGWCDVSAGSKRGYVFKKFIDYGKEGAPSGPVTSSVTLTPPAKARPVYQAPTP